MRHLLGFAGLLLAASAFSIGPAVTTTEAATLPALAQTPDTNPPSRNECQRLSADAQVRTLDDAEKGRLSLCLAIHRNEPEPAAPDGSGADPLGKEGQG
jgi:hypothetical protein